MELYQILRREPVEAWGYKPISNTLFYPEEGARSLPTFYIDSTFEVRRHMLQHVFTGAWGYSPTSMMPAGGYPLALLAAINLIVASLLPSSTTSYFASFSISLIFPILLVSTLII